MPIFRLYREAPITSGGYASGWNLAWTLDGLERGLLTATRLKLVSPISIPGIEIVWICRGYHGGFSKRRAVSRGPKMSLMAQMRSAATSAIPPLLGDKRH
jgi:hypothetical protein